MASVNAGVNNHLMWPNYHQDNLKLVKPYDGNQLGKDDFLKILMTQLQNQDPTQPLQDKEFIAQMAQFTSVEQLTSINQQLSTLQQAFGMSSNLIGKQITWTSGGEMGTDGNPGETTLKSGVVDSIIVRNGLTYAKVGDVEVDMTLITEIRNANDGSASNPSTSNAEKETDVSA
ncbi:flagellar hook capping FlgD N-terminal domain-containing protein [Paenibacillus assamensis]|uniref:flagellar hook capping FlgD N-terminal domain-containing protein n=1 Tax=Paenibacillus assamensis TaxID=311244 RepID=UPI00042077C8|nr:flagellar hook capping FlgD N-terminal domain-containing protein [Paenibacillus assamensis]